MSSAGTPARDGSPAPVPRQQSGEERYLEVLELARAGWWSSENFDTWKKLYVGEYPRGFLIAFAEKGARCAGIECFDTSLERGRLRSADHGVEVDLRKGVAESIPAHLAQRSTS